MKPSVHFFSPAKGKRTKLQSDDVFNMREKLVHGQPHCCRMLGDKVSYKNQFGRRKDFLELLSWSVGPRCLWLLNKAKHRGRTKPHGVVPRHKNKSSHLMGLRSKRNGRRGGAGISISSSRTRPNDVTCPSPGPTH